MTARRRGVKLRTFFNAVVAIGVIYLAVIAVALAVRVVATTRALQAYSSRVAEVHDIISDRLQTLHVGVVTVGRAVRESGQGKATAATLDRLHEVVSAGLDSTIAVGASAALEPVPITMRLHLATAASSESEAHTALLDAIAALRLGRRDQAAVWLARAESLRTVTAAHLTEAQRLALADVVNREAALTHTAEAATRLVYWWIGGGLLLAVLGAFAVQRRLYQPLAGLEHALTRVARGDLAAIVAVRRDDELGRLGHHFNTMTEVLRARAEEERRRVEGFEERFRAAFEQAGFGIAEIDLQGRFQRVNPALCRILGHEAAALIGRRVREVTHPGDVETEGEVWRRLLDGSLPVARRDKRYLTREGRTVWAHVTSTPMRGPDGAVEAIIAVTEDVTERRSLQEQLIRSQRMESVGRLAGGVAHDFNNLLTAILGYLELAKQEMGRDDQARADLEEVERAARRAGELTGQLLVFARRQVVDPRVVDLNDLVEGVEKLMRRLLGDQVELVTRLAPQAGAVRVDPGQFEQVLVNLAVNARDAMPEGGRLTVETETLRLDGVQAQPLEVTAGAFARLRVTDTGVGMDPETVARAFEPFFTTKQPGKGTGLGLATCYGIVRQAGGHIGVTSTPGRGTRFEILLPRVADRAERPSPAAATPAPRGGETVLVAEDEPQVRDLAVRTLREHGYEVLVASDGEEAARVASSHSRPVDLLVTDLRMPRVSGRELALRLQETRPALRVLYISGFTDETGGMPEGLDFLPKPFTPTTLARRVRDALDTDGRR